MFIGFNLNLKRNDPQSFFNVSDIEIEEYEKEMADLKETMQSKINQKISLSDIETNTLNGSKLIKEWFPNYEADVFISHSHKDVKIAKRLACWLKREFDLRAFIDSTVWGNNADLLKSIDNKYAKSGDHTYDYNIRNFTTSHVHMMLSTALNDMIYSTECLIFLNTPESLSVTEVKNEQTNSPWIYNELKIASTIRRVYPRGEGKFSTNTYQQRNSLVINYDMDDILLKLEDLNGNRLQEWQKESQNSFNHPLDVLYSLVAKN